MVSSALLDEDLGVKAETLDTGTLWAVQLDPWSTRHRAEALDFLACPSSRGQPSLHGGPLEPRQARFIHQQKVRILTSFIQHPAPVQQAQDSAPDRGDDDGHILI